MLLRWILACGLVAMGCGDDPRSAVTTPIQPVAGSTPARSGGGSNAAGAGTAASPRGGEAGTSPAARRADAAIPAGPVAAESDAGDDFDAGAPDPGAREPATPVADDRPPIQIGSPRAWQAVEVPGAVCDDGTPALFRVNVDPNADELLIFLEQGGACVPGACISMHDDSAGDAGVFDRRSSTNPFRDWNYVYVPYCTGDLHAGDRPDADVDGTKRQFVGYRNLGLFLDRIVPTFRDVNRVALVGSSAGGFGATLNFPRTQRAFGAIEVVLIVDSAPLMAAPTLAACQQQLWRETWNLDATVLRDCGADCSDPDYWTSDFWRHLATRYPDRRGGIFSTDADVFIRTLYGVGLDDCRPPLIPIVSDADYTAGLRALREQLQAEPTRFGVYVAPGLWHICFQDSCFETTEVSGTRLDSWVSELLSGTVRNVGL